MILRRNLYVLGFHEAVGDVIALSVSTTKHLRKLGLLNETVDDPKVILNNLYMVNIYFTFVYSKDTYFEYFLVYLCFSL